MFSKSDFSDHVKFWTYDSGVSPAVYASNVPDPQYMEAIGQQDYTKGRAPLETLPAQWWNWLLNGETDRFNNLWSYTTYLIDEINNLLDLVGISPTTGNTDLTQLKTMFNADYFNFFSDFMLRASGGAEAWVETAGHTYAVAIADYDGSTTYKTTKASTLPVLLGGTGANNAQDGLENLCANVPAAVGSAASDEVLFKDGTDVKKVSLTDMAPEIYDLIKASIQADNLYTMFQMPFVNSQSQGTAKTITFPAAYDPANNPDQQSLTFKVLFQNGHTTLGSLDYMTLNGTYIVSYQNGTLNYLPIYELTTSVYETVGAGTLLELYYNPDWDGLGNAAWVVVGNPVVLSGAGYTIYADGQNGGGLVGQIAPFYSNTAPINWLSCDGSTFDQTKYPALYKYLGNSNTLPDLRECVLVGIGQSSNDYNADTNPNGIHEHDVYTLGQFKDDQLQGHEHSYQHTYKNQNATGNDWSVHNDLSNYVTSGIVTDNTNGTPRIGKTTHGKQIGVLYCIKAV